MERLLIRMALWVRRPPSRRHLLVLAIVAAVAVFCLAFEAMFGWPDWLSAHRRMRLPRL
ncbi:hypothetical protein GCM10028812_53170 [Ancylobacter sonchi]